MTDEMKKLMAEVEYLSDAAGLIVAPPWPGNTGLEDRQAVYLKMLNICSEKKAELIRLLKEKYNL